MPKIWDEFCSTVAKRAHALNASLEATGVHRSLTLTHDNPNQITLTITGSHTRNSAELSGGRKLHLYLVSTGADFEPVVVNGDQVMLSGRNRGLTALEGVVEQLIDDIAKHL